MVPVEPYKPRLGVIPSRFGFVPSQVTTKFVIRKAVIQKRLRHVLVSNGIRINPEDLTFIGPHSVHLHECFSSHSSVEINIVTVAHDAMHYGKPETFHEVSQELDFLYRSPAHPFWKLKVVELVAFVVDR